jgi:hypothetical protein
MRYHNFAIFHDASDVRSIIRRLPAAAAAARSLFLKERIVYSQYIGSIECSDKVFFTPAVARSFDHSSTCAEKRANTTPGFR